MNYYLEGFRKKNLRLRELKKFASVPTVTRYGMEHVLLFALCISHNCVFGAMANSLNGIIREQILILSSAFGDSWRNA